MISVIIPVYNCQQYIDQMLQSLWHQTYQNFEVICIDDGSSDESLRRLNEQKKCHDQLIVLSQKNLGPSAARNRGIEMAKGQYICFIDADDQIEPCYLSDLHEMAEKTQADLTMCHIDRIYEGKPGFLEKKFRYIQNCELDHVCDVDSSAHLLVQIMNAPFAKLIRKDFLMKHQIRFITGKIAQDLLFTKSMLLYGAKLAVVPSVNYHYLVRPGSITTSRLDRAYDLVDVFDELMRLSDSLKKTQQFHEELEYLCLYHLGIDMAYRIFKATKNPVKGIVAARKRMKAYGFDSKNMYVQQMHWAVRLFLKVYR